LAVKPAKPATEMPAKSATEPAAKQAVEPAQANPSGQPAERGDELPLPSSQPERNVELESCPRPSPSPRPSRTARGWRGTRNATPPRPSPSPSPNPSTRRAASSSCPLRAATSRPPRAASCPRRALRRTRCRPLRRRLLRRSPRHGQRMRISSPSRFPGRPNPAAGPMGSLATPRRTVCGASSPVTSAPSTPLHRLIAVRASYCRACRSP